MKHVALALLFFTGFSHAGTWHKSKIDLVYPLYDGNFIIGLTTENSTCENSNGFYRVYIDQFGVTMDGSNKMYAAVLAAAAQQKEVEIHFDIADSQCYISKIKLLY